MKKIVFMGTPGFSVPILEKLIKSDYEVELVVTQPDRPVGRKKTLTPPPVKEAALAHGLRVFQPERLREDYQFIMDIEPDLIITAAYGQLLPKELLDAPKYGAINVHASLLPELRGGAPIHYAILQGKSTTGITIMDMIEQLDAGDIITQEEVVITEEDTVGSLHDKLSIVGAQLLIKTLPRIFSGDVSRVKQDEALATFAPNILRSDEKIDWSNDARTIYNQVRGLCPWPVAYTVYEDKNMKIWSSKLTDASISGAPGEIVSITENNESIIVATGSEHGIEITEIQPAGRKRMSVKDYLQGNREAFSIGKIFGENL